MGQCKVCKNDYHRTFAVTMDGVTHEYDCWECAFTDLAMECSCCGCRILGHGAEANGEIYCCAHCARAMGVSEIRDRAG